MLSRRSEAIQLIRMHARTGPLPDNQVHAKVLHRGIENLLKRGLQAVDFIEKEKIAQIERSKQRRQVALLFEYSSPPDLDCRAHLVGENLRKRRFAEPRRTVEQDGVECFASS